MIVHAEMAPRLTFCGKQPVQLPDEDRVIAADDWHRETEVIQHATCEDCLLRIFMLGDSANLALARMGRKVEIRDVDPVSLSEN